MTYYFSDSYFDSTNRVDWTIHQDKQKNSTLSIYWDEVKHKRFESEKCQQKRQDLFTWKMWAVLRR